MRRAGRPGRALLALALLAIVATSAASGAPGRAAAGTGDSETGVERLLVFSVPTLTWKDLQRHEAPELEALLAEAAVADLSVRSVTRRTSAVDAYTTLNAGTRAEGTTPAQLAFEVGDEHEGTSAAEEFARRTGVAPEPPEVFNFGLVSLLSTNAALHFGAQVGVLGDALATAGISRAVIANGDHPGAEELVELRREATVGLIDGSGLVPDGAIGVDLLERDPAAPFGIRYDNDAVGDAFEDLWRDHQVVLVEASDFVRYEAFRTLATDAQRAKLKGETLAHSDELLGRLIEHVDPERDAVLVVAPYAEGAGVEVTVVGLRAPGIEPGLLSSGTTRRAGFVQTPDLAPTVLDLFGIDKPVVMEGTPTERAAGGGSYEDRVEFLAEASAAATFRDSVVGPASTYFVFAQLALWLLAALAMTRRIRPLGRGVEVGALAVLGVLPATFLARLLPFHDWGVGTYWLFVVAVGAVIGITSDLLGRRGLVDPLLFALGSIVGLLTVDVLAGDLLQFNTVFGYTPTVAGRFAGLGNPAFAMLAAAGILLATLLAHRIGGRRGVWVAIAVLAWLVILDGMPFWGADVGGVLALVPACGLTAWLLLGYRVRLRAVLGWGLGAVVAVLAFGAIDLARPAARQTHLGRLLERMRDEGWEAFEVVVLRKLEANFAVLASSVWTLMLPVVFAFVAYLFWRAPWRLRQIQDAIPQERAALAGLITAMVLGFALNDSGIAIPGMMLGVINAALVHLVLRVGGEEQWEGPPVPWPRPGRRQSAPAPGPPGAPEGEDGGAPDEPPPVEEREREAVGAPSSAGAAQVGGSQSGRT